MAEWWTIEVFHGEREPATRWRDSYLDRLTEAAVTNGALYWEWREFAYGVAFEVYFAEEDQWWAFRNLPVVRGALDSVPDPANGLLIYRGRGGAAGGRQPRKPKPAPGAAALELEEPRRRRRIRLGFGRGADRDAGLDPRLDPGREAPASAPVPDRQSAAQG